MDIGYKEAVEVYDNFPDTIKAPTLHPSYILADATRDKDLKPVFFVYNEGPALYYHGFHMAPIEGANLKDIQSPYGYGGPLSSSDDLEFLSRAWNAYESWCAENNVLVEFLRFHPLLKNWRFFNGEVIHDRETVWLDLSHEDLMASYSVRVRTAVRKAIKNGLVVEWSNGSADHIRIFMSLYNATMKELGADRLYLFPPEYYQKIFHWDQARLALCRLNNEIIAGAIFLMGPDIMEYHLSAANCKGKKLNATNLLLHEAALLGQQSGCRALYLGGGTDNRPENRLLFFKSGFSKLQASFKIGKKIHRSEDYSQIKRNWEQMHGVISNRILFYR